MVDSFIKLYVKNPTGRVLLGLWEGSWELPGLPWNRGESIQQEVTSIAAEHGLALSSIRLGALITRHWNNRPDPMLMHYYECESSSTELKLPDDGTTKLEWFDRRRADKVIPFEFMKTIMHGIDTHPTQVLAGAHLYTKDAQNEKVINKEITEPLYILS